MQAGSSLRAHMHTHALRCSTSLCPLSGPRSCAPPPQPARVTCTAAARTAEPSTEGRRDRAERDALKQRQRQGGAPVQRQSGVPQQGEDDPVLAAIASCCSQRQLANLHRFLQTEQQQQQEGMQQHTHSSASPSLLLQQDRQDQQGSNSHPTLLPPTYAVHFLTRLSQLSLSPAFSAVPDLDTSIAYSPAHPQQQPRQEESEPGGYVSLQGEEPAPSQQQQQQQDSQVHADHSSPLQGPDAADTGGGGGGSAVAAPRSRHVEVQAEEQADDAASVAAAQQKLERSQLIEGLVADALRGLPQLPLPSITGLLSALARLGYRSGDDSSSAVRKIASHLLSSNALLLMHRRDPRALANTAWALAKLGHDPGLAWINQFLLASSVSLPRLSAVDLSAIAWALARWKFRPSGAWLGAYYTRLKRVAPQLRTQGICNVAWAFAMLRIAAPRDVAEVLMIEAQVQLPFFSATALGTLCWALAALGHRPPNFWLQEVCDRMAHTLPTAPLASRGLPHANTAWALSVWQASPSPVWLDTLCTSATPHLPRMSAASCTVLLTALADLGHRPAQPWVSLALEEFHKRHTDADPASLVAVVWAVSRLLQPTETDGTPPPGWAPPRKWRVRYAHILQDIAWAQSHVFHALQPAQLVDAAVAFADLAFYPGNEWMDRHEAYCNMQVEAFTAYQVRLLSSCMEKLDSVFEGDYLPRDGEVV